MKNFGIGSTADLLFFALMLTLASLILMTFSPQAQNLNNRYSKRVAQNVLLAFQHVPMEELDTFSYHPTLNNFTLSERNLRKKTITQILIEEMLVNPPLVVDNEGCEKVCPGFSKKTEETIEDSLEDFLGKRFGYRLKICMKPLSIGKGGSLQFKKIIQNFDRSSHIVSVESVSLNFAVPKNWLKSTSSNRDLTPLDSSRAGSFPKIVSSKIVDEDLEEFTPSVGEMGTLILTLELWSR